MEIINKELKLIQKYNQAVYDDIIYNINSLKMNGYYELFLRCYESYKEKNKDVMRWEKAFEIILNGFMNSEYNHLLDALKDSDLSTVDINRLGILISNEHNTYDVEDLYDFESFARIKCNSLKECLQDLRFGKSVEEIKKNNLQISRSVNSDLELLKVSYFFILIL